MDGVIGFDKPEVTAEGDTDEISPEIVNVMERLQQQDTKYVVCKS